MPYIDAVCREQLTEAEPTSDAPQTAGQLNYVITAICDQYLQNRVRYASLNEVIGVLECVKLELYRRVAAPYEDRKREENGDVYGCLT